VICSWKSNAFGILTHKVPVDPSYASGYFANCLCADEHTLKLHFGFCLHALIGDILLYHFHRIMNGAPDAMMEPKRSRFMGYVPQIMQSVS
jgi:hypothetical protein